MPTKFVLPLLVILPDKPGDSVTTINSGYTTYTCECGNSYTGHEHSYTEETTEPRCTQAGYTIYTCSCGDSYQVDLPALGHDYVMISQDVSGKRTYRCTRCGATYTDSGVGINPPIDPDPPVEYSLRNSNVTVTTEHHEYVYASGKLLREVITTTDAEGNVSTQTLDFTYDASGNPYSLTYNGTTYYYVVNLQGDVIRLVSGTGATVAEYAYDPYGKVVAVTGTMAEVNPLRYRGYYYDAETEFYYLQSRYYDPVICRFINYDGSLSTGQGFSGYNMFAYCINSPVNATDPSGDISIWYILREAHDWGFIHRLVQKHIQANNVGITTEAHVDRTNGTEGRIDILNTENYLWEVKHGGKCPTARAAEAFSQACTYLNGSLHDGSQVSGLGAAHMFSGSFVVNVNFLGTKYSYAVSYSTPNFGVILYSVREIPQQDNSDYDYTYSAQKRLVETSSLTTAMANASIAAVIYNYYAGANTVTAGGFNAGGGLVAGGGGGFSFGGSSSVGFSGGGGKLINFPTNYLNVA